MRAREGCGWFVAIGGVFVVVGAYCSYCSATERLLEKINNNKCLKRRGALSCVLPLRWCSMIVQHKGDG